MPSIASKTGEETMLKTTLAVLAGLIALIFATLAVAASDEAHYKIVTGPERGTYIQIGQDLSKWVAQPAGITSKWFLRKARRKTFSACVSSLA